MGICACVLPSFCTGMCVAALEMPSSEMHFPSEYRVLCHGLLTLRLTGLDVP